MQKSACTCCICWDNSSSFRTIKITLGGSGNGADWGCIAAVYRTHRHGFVNTDQMLLSPSFQTQGCGALRSDKKSCELRFARIPFHRCGKAVCAPGITNYCKLSPGLQHFACINTPNKLIILRGAGSQTVQGSTFQICLLERLCPLPAGSRAHRAAWETPKCCISKGISS